MAKAAGQCHGTPCLGKGAAPASTGGSETSLAFFVMVMRVEEATAVSPVPGCVIPFAAGIAALVVPMAQPVLATCCCRWALHGIGDGTPAAPLPRGGAAGAGLLHCHQDNETAKSPGVLLSAGQEQRQGSSAMGGLQSRQEAAAAPSSSCPQLPMKHTQGWGGKKQCWEQP